MAKSRAKKASVKKHHLSRFIAPEKTTPQRQLSLQLWRETCLIETKNQPSAARIYHLSSSDQSPPPTRKTARHWGGFLFTQTQKVIAFQRLASATGASSRNFLARKYPYFSKNNLANAQQLLQNLLIIPYNDISPNINYRNT